MVQRQSPSARYQQNQWACGLPPGEQKTTCPHYLPGRGRHTRLSLLFASVLTSQARTTRFGAQRFQQAVKEGQRGDRMWSGQRRGSGAEEEKGYKTKDTLDTLLTLSTRRCGRIKLIQTWTKKNKTSLPHEHHNHHSSKVVDWARLVSPVQEQTTCKKQTRSSFLYLDICFFCWRSLLCRREVDLWPVGNEISSLHHFNSIRHGEHEHSWDIAVIRMWQTDVRMYVWTTPKHDTSSYGCRRRIQVKRNQLPIQHASENECSIRGTLQQKQ